MLAAETEPEPQWLARWLHVRGPKAEEARRGGRRTRAG